MADQLETSSPGTAIERIANGAAPRTRRSKKGRSSRPVGSPTKNAKDFVASIYASSGNAKIDRLPKEFVVIIKELEIEIGMPVWMLIQNGSGSCSQIDGETCKGFQRQKGDIKDGQPVALLIESPGGMPDQAYYIARYFQRRASNFVTVVPNYAKSAGTLIALAGAQIFMGRDAELGPLDVQVFDAEKERFGSALNTIQSLERLHADALSCVDSMMQLLLLRTGKRVDLILPTVLRHATEFVQPLVEKIDTLDYTEKSRAMKMAEDYAIRLMTKAGYAPNEPEAISRRLVTGYADHGFVIDKEEAKSLEVISGTRRTVGLRLAQVTPKTEELFDALLPFLDSLTVVGRLVEVSP